jgi:hypothetical protein
LQPIHAGFTLQQPEPVPFRLAPNLQRFIIATGIEGVLVGSLIALGIEGVLVGSLIALGIEGVLVGSLIALGTCLSSPEVCFLLLARIILYYFINSFLHWKIYCCCLCVRTWRLIVPL